MYKKIINAILVVLILIIVCACSSVEKIALNALYPFDMVEKDYPFTGPPPNWSLVDVNGSRALYYESDADELIIYFHGNGENLETMKLSNMLNALSSFGKDVLVLDYPGQGNNIEPNEQSMRELTQKAISSYPQSRIILFGRSLGSAIAMQGLSLKDPRVKQVILISAFDNFKNAAKAMSFLGKFVPESFIAKHRYDNAQIAADFGHFYYGLIVHGIDDTLVPIELGKKVHDNFFGSVFMQLPKTGHNDIYGNQTLWQNLKIFISEAK
jgi:pimeloyl-ACP methyl ester carboxylesterase